MSDVQRTIKMTVDEIVDASGIIGPTTAQRIRQCCDAAFLLGGLLPSQCTAIHVLRSAYRIEADAQQAILRWQGKGPGPEVEDSEQAALDAADAVVEAEDNFLRLCGSLVVEINRAP